MVFGVPKLKETYHHVCFLCAFGNQHFSPFPLQAIHQDTCILELVNADLVSRIEVSTIGGSFCYMSLINDKFSQKSWVCF